MQGQEIFFADQNLGSNDPDKLTKNEVMTKFRHFIKVSPKSLFRNFGIRKSNQLKINYSAKPRGNE